MPRIPVSLASVNSLRGTLTDLIGKENVSRDGVLKYTHLLHSIAAGFGFKDYQQFNHHLGAGAAPADAEFDSPAMFERLADFGWDEDNHAAGQASFALACTTPLGPLFDQGYFAVHEQLAAAYPYSSWAEVNDLVLNGQFPLEHLEIADVQTIARKLDQGGYRSRQQSAPPARLADLVQTGTLTQAEALQLEECLVRGSKILIAGPIASRPSLFMQSLLREGALLCPLAPFWFHQTRLERCELPDNVFHCWNDYSGGETIVIGGKEAPRNARLAVDRLEGQGCCDFCDFPGSIASMTAEKSAAMPRLTRSLRNALGSEEDSGYVARALRSIDVIVYLNADGAPRVDEIVVANGKSD